MLQESMFNIIKSLHDYSSQDRIEMAILSSTQTKQLYYTDGYYYSDYRTPSTMAILRFIRQNYYSPWTNGNSDLLSTLATFQNVTIPLAERRGERHIVILFISSTPSAEVATEIQSIKNEVDLVVVIGLGNDLTK